MLITFSVQRAITGFWHVDSQTVFLRTCCHLHQRYWLRYYSNIQHSPNHKFVPGSAPMTWLHFHWSGIPLSSILTSKKTCLEDGFIASKLFFFLNLLQWFIHLDWLAVWKEQGGDYMEIQSNFPKAQLVS